MDFKYKRRVSGHSPIPSVAAVLLSWLCVAPIGAVVIVGGDNGWEVSFDGNVNGFLVYEDGDPRPSEAPRSVRYNYQLLPSSGQLRGSGGLSIRQGIDGGDDTQYEEECEDENGFFGSGGGCGFGNSFDDSSSDDSDESDESEDDSYNELDDVGDDLLGGELTFLSAAVPVANRCELADQDLCHINATIAARLTGGTLGNDTRASRVRTGLLPAFFSFNVRSPEVAGLRGSARISFAPQIQNANTKNQFGSQVDLREVFFNVDGSFGALSVGRTLSLFQRQSILNDMTLFGVGVQGAAGDGGTTLGRIGYGYVYPQFNARIAYRTPTIQGFQLEVGLYDPSKICHERGTCARRTKIPRVETELTYAISHKHGAFKGWFGSMWQRAETDTEQEVTAWGVTGGLRLSFLGFALTSAGYTGEALGSVLMLDSDSLDVLGNERDNHGWYVQGTYSLGALTVGVSYGENNADQTVVDRSISHNTTLPRQINALFSSLGPACQNQPNASPPVVNVQGRQISAACAAALTARPILDTANPRQDRTIALTMPVPIDKLSSFTFGAYYDATSWLKLVAEYSRVTNDWHDWAGQDFEVDSNVFSAGAFFLW